MLRAQWFLIPVDMEHIDKAIRKLVEVLDECLHGVRILLRE